VTGRRFIAQMWDDSLPAAAAPASAFLTGQSLLVDGGSAHL
jgi:hypothetical protein